MMPQHGNDCALLAITRLHLSPAVEQQCVRCLQAPCFLALLPGQASACEATRCGSIVICAGLTEVTEGKGSSEWRGSAPREMTSSLFAGGDALCVETSWSTPSLLLRLSSFQCDFSAPSFLKMQFLSDSWGIFKVMTGIWNRHAGLTKKFHRLFVQRYS